MATENPNNQPEAKAQFQVTLARAILALAERDVFGFSSFSRAVLSRDDELKRRANEELAARAHHIQLGHSTLAEEINNQSERLTRIVGNKDASIDDIISLRESLFAREAELQEARKTQHGELTENERKRKLLSDDIQKIQKIFSGLDILFSEVGDVSIGQEIAEYFRESARLFVLQQTGRIKIVDDPNQNELDNVDQRAALRRSVAQMPSREALRPQLPSSGEITFSKESSRPQPIDPNEYIPRALEVCGLDPDEVRKEGINLSDLSKVVTAYLKRLGVDPNSIKFRETHLIQLITGNLPDKMTLDDAFPSWSSRPGRQKIETLQAMYQLRQGQMSVVSPDTSINQTNESAASFQEVESSYDIRKRLIKSRGGLVTVLDSHSDGKWKASGIRQFRYDFHGTKKAQRAQGRVWEVNEQEKEAFRALNEDIDQLIQICARFKVGNLKDLFTLMRPGKNNEPPKVKIDFDLNNDPVYQAINGVLGLEELPVHYLKKLESLIRLKENTDYKPKTMIDLVNKLREHGIRDDLNTAKRPW